jgi:hypothetical protein
MSHTTLTTDIHATGEIQTHDLSRRAAADLRLRPRGHWDRHRIYTGTAKSRTQHYAWKFFTYTRPIIYNIFDSNCPFASSWSRGKTLHLYSESNSAAASRNLRCRVLENSIFVFTTARLSLSLFLSLSLSL